MAKILKFILKILVVGFLGFVGWMNMTPGYFQIYPCSNKVGYYIENYDKKGIGRICNPFFNIRPSMTGRILLWLAKFDLNK